VRSAIVNVGLHFAGLFILAEIARFAVTVDTVSLAPAMHIFTLAAATTLAAWLLIAAGFVMDAPVRSLLRTTVLSPVVATCLFVLHGQLMPGEIVHFSVDFTLVSAVLLLVSAFASLLVIAARLLDSRFTACCTAIALAGLSAGAPVWFAPIAERLSDMQFLTDLSIAISPLSYLAVIADFDYLRTPWFYAHSALGSIRYSYPNPWILAAAYAVTAGIGLALILRRKQVPFVAAAILAFVVTGNAVAAPATTDVPMDIELQGKTKRAIDAGLHYLRGQQADDGSWSNSVGVTALALRGFLESHRGYNEGDGAFVTRPIEFLLAHVNDDGSISETNQNRNYNTAVAVPALQATNNPDYERIIADAGNFLVGLQLDAENGYEPEHKYYGGIGYGGDERPDLSNQYMAVEALRAADLHPDDPVWERALTFISRSQNRSESNDQEWAANDGGFTYMPGFSPHGGTDSYGSMTHAGLISLLFAGVDKDDPRVQAAYDWIRGNYTLDRNPGAVDNQGLYYYYNTFAKSMAAYDETEVVDIRGDAHNWRNDLATKLISLQESDGSWVNNDSPRWWEGDRNLVTAWSVIALNLVVR
jgi:squalene-hopene/tetraprenyl-beta-curcumene cyclase